MKMKKMIDLVKEKKEILIRYGCNLLVLFLFWGGLLRSNFNADTLSHMYSADADVMINILDGRYVIALFDWILLQFGMRVTDQLGLSVLIALLLFAINMTLLQKMFEKFGPQNLLGRLFFDGAVSLVFLNVLFSEEFMFVECCIYFGIAYLLTTLGALFYSKRRFGLSLLFLFLGVCTYQYSVVFAAIILAFYLMLDCEANLTVKHAIAELIGIAICLGMGAINIVIIHFVTFLGVGEYRKSMDAGNWSDKLTAAARAIVELNRSSYGIMDAFWMPAFVSLAVVAITIYLLVRKKEFRKLIYFLLVYVGSLLLLFVIPLLNNKFNFPPRMAFCFYLVQGLMIVSVFFLIRENIPTVRPQLMNGICVIVAAYLAVQYLYVSFVVENRFVSNTMDMEIAIVIDRELDRYESQTETAVTKIAIVKDSDAPNHYERVDYADFQINERTIVFAPCSLIRYTTGRELERIDGSSEVYEKYFKDCDWDSFDPKEQLVIEGDTAYWCIF